MEYTIELARERVRKGAALLDYKCPGWAKKIDKSQLSITNALSCVLAQIYGHSWIVGLRELGLTRADGWTRDEWAAVEHGFVAATYAYSAVEAQKLWPDPFNEEVIQHMLLKAAWIEQIELRVPDDYPDYIAPKELKEGVTCQI